MVLLIFDLECGELALYRFILEVLISLQLPFFQPEHHIGLFCQLV